MLIKDVVWIIVGYLDLPGGKNKQISIEVVTLTSMQINQHNNKKQERIINKTYLFTFATRLGGMMFDFPLQAVSAKA